MMTIFNKIIQNIQKTQKPLDGSIELECRLFIDPRLKTTKQYKIPFDVVDVEKYVKKFIKKILKIDQTSIKLESTINFIINSSKYRNIKQLVYENGKQISKLTNHYTKKNILRPEYTIIHPNDINVKISIAEEIKNNGEDFSLHSVNETRIRQRLAIVLDEEKYPDFTDWRIDLTLVKSISGLQIENVKKYRKLIFDEDITIENFVDKASWDKIDNIELELEYIGDDVKKITENSFQVLSSLTNLFLDNKKITPEKNYFYEIYKITKNKYFKSKITFKMIGNSAYELNRDIFKKKVLSDIDNYWVTDKTDGVRTFVVCEPIEDKMIKINLISANNYETYTIPNKYNIKKSIGDTERYTDKKHDFIIPLDIIMYDGKIISDLTFDYREKYLKLFANLLGKKGKCKPFIKLDNKNYSKQILKLYNRKDRFYEIDGLIFTSSNGNYKETKNYKWKPISHMSVDFIIKKCPSKLLGIDPYIKIPKKNLYLLFSGINNNVFKNLRFRKIKYYKELFPNSNHKYFPTTFSPPDNPYAYLCYSNKNDLDNKLGEFIYDINKKQWNLLRIREDRQKEVDLGEDLGNNFWTALNIWDNYKNPLTIQEITSKKIEDSKDYFQEHNSGLHKAQRSFNSYVKSMLLNNYRNIEWAIDLGAGKGQDIFRMANLNWKNVLIVDIDKSALKIVHEKIQQLASGRNLKKHQKSKDISIYTQHMNLNNDYKKNIQQIINSKIPIPKMKVSLIICNFALHYMLRDSKSITNIIKFIHSLLEKDGIFIFTAFDGKSVFDKLENNNGVYEVYEGEVLKYYIESNYKKKTFNNCGQTIKVLLPFSRGELYEEPLINNKFLKKEFAKHNMERIGFNSFIKFYNNNSHIKLSEKDKEYISLYHYSIYKKIK